jgi:uncharacterized protein YecE (DUF72 family)
MKLKVGCCGFPKGMERYFREFDLVEVQQTFYKLPQVETVQRWREKAPSNFEFAIKAWQLITHPPSSPTYRKAGLNIPPDKINHYGFFKPTDEVWEAWRSTAQIAEALGCRVVVFQCPASFSESPENIHNLKNFFHNIKREFLMAWEPRGEWKEETVRRLCQEMELIHCVDPFLQPALHGEVRYYRLHGGPGYRHKYSQEELERLKGMLGEGENYVLFNNIAMYEDAQRFLLLCKLQ